MCMIRQINEKKKYYKSELYITNGRYEISLGTVINNFVMIKYNIDKNIYVT